MKYILELPRGWQSYPLRIAFCPSAKAYRREAKAYGQDLTYPCAPRAAHCVRLVSKKYSPSILVMIGDKVTDPSLVTSLLVHESVHAWQFAAEALGVVNPDLETEAYSIQGIFDHMRGAYNDTLGKKHGIRC